MTRTFSKIRNGVTAVAILGCLAFGGSQAFATSSTGTAAPKAACSQCKKECPGFGGTYTRNRCYCCG